MMKFREQAGMSQEGLSEAAEVSRNFISNIERGIKAPSLETYVKLVNALSISSDLLLADEIHNAYPARASVLQDKMESLPEEDKRRIFTIIEAFLDKQ